MIIKIFQRICCAIVLMLSIGFSASQAEGDVEYGQYLSSECVTCHQVEDNDGAIPSLVGLGQEHIGEVLKLYRDEQLENQAMQTVAKRLTDEDIAALAAYYASLPIQE